MSDVDVVWLAAEWVTGPLWVYRTGESAPDNYTPERFATDFDVPADLVADIDAWDAAFQAVYVHDDPAESGFRTRRPGRLGRSAVNSSPNAWPRSCTSGSSWSPGVEGSSSAPDPRAHTG